MKIEIKRRYTGLVISSYTCENNTMNMTVGNAIKCDADLRYADLIGADLSGADLIGADLRYADLRYANLSGADLSGADGVKYAQLTFSGFGESNRLISLIEMDDELIFFCGCFNGNKERLKKYIEEGKEVYKKSRTLAMDTLITLIDN